MTAPIRWERLPFDELTARTLYAVLALRADVFVVEQECAYMDTDGLDLGADHLLGWRGDDLVAYARLLPSDYYKPGVTSVGRIAIARSDRRTGLGRALVQRAIDILRADAPAMPIRIAAQEYLMDFYASFGFVAFGDSYLEDGIVHRDMLLASD